MPDAAFQERGEASSVPPIAKEIAEGYKGQDSPLGGYAVLMGIYGLTMAGFLIAQRRSRRAASIGVGDLLLLGVATHKTSRLITKDSVTAPIRAAFTEYKESTGANEVSEKPRGKGFQQAVGQLFT